MQTYVLRKLLFTLPVLLGVFTIVFLLIHLIPGDPVELILGEQALQANKATIRAELGLDKPLLTQYADTLQATLKGDLRKSFSNNTPVADLILKAFPYTLALAVIAVLLSLCLAIPLGIVSALKRNSLLDNTAMVAALLGVSVPTFWGGPLLIIIFSLKLNLLPVSGADDPLAFVLPALTLALGLTGITTRMVRGSMLEAMQADFIVTARAKGLPEWLVILKHGLRNALLSVITVVGLQFGALLSGAVITETIFGWPGIGRLLTQSIFMRDIPVIQGCILFIAAAYVVINLLTDILYGLVDPKIRDLYHENA